MTILDFAVRTAHLGGDAYVASVSGEADLYTAPRVGEELDRIIDRGGKRIVVDLQNAPFIDSTLLGVLVEARRRLRDRDGRVLVVTHDRRIVRTFEITGLDRVFTIHARLADAVGDACRTNGAG